MLGKVPEIPAELPAKFSSFEFWRPRSARIAWALAAFLALIFHLAILFPRIPGFLFVTEPQVPPRVDIKQVDPKKLEAIRRQWKSREKALLLDKNLHVPSAEKPPEDARYMSDRNIRVERETRARRSDVIPKEGAPGKPQPETAEPKTRAEKSPSRKLPNLGALGVPLPAAPKESPPPRQAAAAGADGQNQTILDDQVAEGSENLLNAEESVYYSFYARLYESIGSMWKSRVYRTIRSRRVEPGEYVTHVDAVLDRDGNLVSIQLLSSSRLPEFDQAAIMAWKSIGRFPNPPTGMLDSEGRVHMDWSFTVSINEGVNFDYIPPRAP